MVSVILDNLAAGLTAEEIAESYPTVSVDAVTAALHYATELAKERTVPLAHRHAPCGSSSDENLPVQLRSLFAESGHDAATVVDEGLGGASDVEVAAVCIGEERVLVTQDLDFSDIRTYPPAEHYGIVVFRLSTGHGMPCWRWPPF